MSVPIKMKHGPKAPLIPWLTRVYFVGRSDDRATISVEEFPIDADPATVARRARDGYSYTDIKRIEVAPVAQPLAWKGYSVTFDLVPSDA